MKPPEISGITGLHEIGRTNLTVAFKGESSAGPMVCEVLIDNDEESRAEFYRTGALQSRMGHPGMPPIQYSGIYEESRPYRVREFVVGRPVSGLYTDGPLSVAQVISASRALASTLSALHKRGMVHTLVHPEGLRIDSSGQIRFIDTGRGWPVLRPLPPCERRFALQYGAPEAVEGALARTENDIYSLGVLVAALAAGKPAPPNGMTPDFLKESTRKLPPALRVLLRCMLDKDPAKRPEAQTIVECLSQVDELSALLRLRSWKPPTGASTFLGNHAYTLVGRDKELAKLMNLWQTATKNKSVSVTILGPKGSGRRRLVEELRRVVEQSGGAVVRHRLDAEPDKPSLIVNYSHKGLQEQNPDSPWLSVNFAETGPVNDQHTIELKPLAESDCVRLAELYLASPIADKLRTEFFQRGPMLPGQVLQNLDEWCEAGVLRPNRGRWLFESLADSPADEPRTELVRKVPGKRLKLDYAAAGSYLTEMWPTNMVQDDPLVACLESLCTALKAQRADLFGIENGQVRHACASSLGRNRLDNDLLEHILRKPEPVWSDGNLLFPLQCGISYCGFLSLRWWDEGIPEYDGPLFQLLSVATSPFALMLGQTQLQERRLVRLTASLRELLKATQEPIDILTRLSESLKKSLEFETLTAWLVREGKLKFLFSSPPGETPTLEQGASYFQPPYEHREITSEQDLLLAIPLADGEELLGGITISRDPLTPFSRPEEEWAGALTKVAETVLIQARAAGAQAASPSKAR